MGRRIVSEEEERQLVADAEEARDNGTRAKLANVKVSSDATAVLSVRVPIEQLRTMRQLASERGASLSTLLQEAVDQLLSSRGPRVSYSQRVTRLFVTGATAEVLGDNDSETKVITERELAVTW